MVGEDGIYGIGIYDLLLWCYVGNGIAQDHWALDIG